jgi:hypothetical protein
MKRILLLALVAGISFAQNAEVHDLLPGESTEGARLFKAMEDSKAAYECWTVKMSAKYLKAAGAAGVGDFSPGFKHIVPRYPYGSNITTCCSTTIFTPGNNLIQGSGGSCLGGNGYAVPCKGP